MVAATAEFCFRPLCPALHTFEFMAGRLAPLHRRAFTAAISAVSSSCRRGLTGEQRFSPRWALSNFGAVATRRAFSREGDGGRRDGPVAEVYEQYGGQLPQASGEFPRPPLIKWEKDLANGVHLIGNVGKEIELKYTDSGNIVGTTSLAVKKSSKRSEEPSWFLLEIWDDLAEIAAHHVAKGERIYVTGKVVVDKRVNDADVTSTIVKVVVSDLCFVESYANDQRQAYGQSNDEVMVTRSSNQSQAEITNISSSQQNWNQQQPSSQSSRGMAVQKGSSSSSSEAAVATEKRWQVYFADPTQWWDNRKNKRNPKAPDFKHKSTDEALWINSWSNPPWVAQQLAVLEERKAQHGGDFAGSSRSKDKNLSSFKDSDLLY